MPAFFREKIDAGEMEHVEISAEDRHPDCPPGLLCLERRSRARRKEPSAGEIEKRAFAAASRKFEGAKTYVAALKMLARQLRSLSDKFPEMTDTDIRERTWDALVHAHFHRTPGYSMPHGFNLDSPEAEGKVRAVLTAFVARANLLADAEGLDAPEKRHAAFNAAPPELELDEFFGWSETLSPPSEPIEGTAEQEP